MWPFYILLQSKYISKKNLSLATKSRSMPLTAGNLAGWQYFHWETTISTWEEESVQLCEQKINFFIIQMHETLGWDFLRKWKCDRSHWICVCFMQTKLIPDVTSIWETVGARGNQTAEMAVQVMDFTEISLTVVTESFERNLNHLDAMSKENTNKPENWFK